MLIIVPVEEEHVRDELVRALQNSGYAPQVAESADDLVAALGLEPVSMDDIDLSKFDSWTAQLVAIMNSMSSRTQKVDGRVEIIKALALTEIAKTLARGLPPIV